MSKRTHPLALSGVLVGGTTATRAPPAREVTGFGSLIAARSRWVETHDNVSYVASFSPRVPAGSVACLVNVAAVTDTQCEDHEFLIVDVVDDAVVTGPYPPLS